MARLVNSKRVALRWLGLTHRWLGVITCLFFLTWFATGAVMLFQPFPALEELEGLRLSEPISLSSVKLSPSDAFGAEALRLASIKLVTVAGQPLYKGVSRSGVTSIRSAVSGAPFGGVGTTQARIAAERFAGSPALTVAGPLDYDQWIVSSQYDPGRPYYRVRLGDMDGTDLYVSRQTGQIWQRTTASERRWSWVGSIIHWAYFTPLGKHRSLWNTVLWSVSLVAFAGAFLGMALGIQRHLAARRAGRVTPYPKAWLRWHHLSGLGAGLIVVAMVGSGWLSNDDGRLFSVSGADAATLERFAGTRDPAGLDRLPDSRFAGKTEIAFVGVGGTPYMVGRGGQPDTVTVVEARSGRTVPAIPLADIRRGLEAGWPGAPVAAVHAGPADQFYIEAEGLSSPVRGFELAGTTPAHVFIHRDTGDVTAVMDRSRRAHAILSYGLHTFRWPGWTSPEPLRKAVMCLLLLLGSSIAITGIVLGTRRLRRSIPFVAPKTAFQGPRH